MWTEGACANSQSSCALSALHADSQLLVHDVVTAVYIQGLARNQPRRVMSQEGGRNSNVLDADEAARRRFCLRLVQECIELRNSRRRPSCERPGRDRVYPNTLRSELGREVPHRRL